MTRATLGHTGRTLIAGPGTALVYACVSLGALLRVTAPLLTGSEVLLCLAGALWGGAFLLFAAIYGPLLLRPRAGAGGRRGPRPDGSEGQALREPYVVSRG
jgi:uncharacterized protein involved in response to NO